MTTAASRDVPRSIGADPRLRWARTATLASLAAAVVTSLVMPGIGLLVEPRAVWVVLGALGLLAFVVAQAGALYAAATPWVSEERRRTLALAFAGAGVLTVPLVGPVGADDWDTWAWLGGSIAGTAPLLVARRTAAAIMVMALGVAVGVGWWADGSPGAYALICVSVGLSIAVMSGLPLWLWALLVEARAGRAAQGRLAAAEERLRFARDVHDLLGHNLTVIALKAELTERVAPRDAGQAAREASEIQRLAASALTDVRQAIHGYRTVDLRDQLQAIDQVLQSSGVRCTIIQPADDLPPAIATELATLVREASTNVLRHSRAGWCTIEIARSGDEVRMTVANDGAGDVRPDRHSSGLRGLSERLATAGGSLRTHVADGVFTLEATLRAAP